MRYIPSLSPLDRVGLTATYAASEYQIIDCLPTEVRLGVVMVKALLRQYGDCPITSYMVKTALFFILSERIESGEMEKLTKPDNPDQWITTPKAHQFYKEGRQWAIDILNRIKVIETSFFDNVTVKNVQEATPHCDKLLEFLRY